MSSIIRVVGYSLTDDPDFMDHQNHMTPYLKDRIQDLYFDIHKGRKFVIPFILKLIDKFPENPQLKNCLSIAYNNIGEIEKSEDVNQWVLKEHPDYLFGRLNIAAAYFHREEFDKIPELLGEKMELKDLYPNRDVFHVDEFTSFTKFAIQYFLEIGDVKAAESRLNLLNEMFPNHRDTQSIRDWYHLRLLEKGIKGLTAGKTKKITVQQNSFSEVQTSENPVFVHPEIYCLYEFDLSIPHVFIENILALPRETVIPDLELVINDSISRFRYFEELSKQERIREDRLTFPLHAILLLGELKAKESLGLILKFLSFESDFLFFWLGDHKTETIYEPLYYLGESQLDQLKAFMFRPNVDTYVKTSVLTAVQQIYFYQPHRKNEVIHWYDQVIDYFIENADNPDLNSREVLAFIVSDITEIREKRLLPDIERLFRMTYVSEGICGTIQKVRNEIEKEGENQESKQDLLDIFNRYLGFIGTFLPRRKKQENGFLKKSISIPQHHNVEVYTKVGQDDPCPCGSGSKFKDCCMNRLN
jgi:tetratricopeptide (TPR) repeat protein